MAAESDTSSDEEETEGGEVEAGGRQGRKKNKSAVRYQSTR
jgi:hypothetical protein